MMRWNKGDTGFEIKERSAVVSGEGDDGPGTGVLLNHLIETLAATLARVGVTSVAVVVTMALLIATVLFGLVAGDAVALGQWCRKC